MSGRRINDETRDRIKTLLDADITHRQIAEQVGVSTSTVSVVRQEYEDTKSQARALEFFQSTPPESPEVVPTGRIGTRGVRVAALPARGQVNRYIVTAAQNATLLHQSFDTLRAMAFDLEAELLVARITYNGNTHQLANEIKGRGAKQAEQSWYAPELEPYLVDGPVQLAPKLIFCAELNVIASAANPLSGLQGYGARSSIIVPHTKQNMASVPSTSGFEGAKLQYATGAVTQRNYTATAAGAKADFHHIYGALLVEVDHEGHWWVRQLNAETDTGEIVDLGYAWAPDVQRHYVGIEAINFGDIHLDRLDLNGWAWNTTAAMADALRPKFQVFHDILDFRARCGHILKKEQYHEGFANWVAGYSRVQDEVNRVAKFLRTNTRPGCTNVIVESNHDRFMLEWLRIADAYKWDHGNAIYWLKLQTYVYETLAKNPNLKALNLLEWAVKRAAEEYGQSGVFAAASAVFLKEEDSMTIAGDIEIGMHGHLGPNGARGSAVNLARLGRKINKGHDHSASIVDGVFTAGITGSLDQGYNRGPSGWSHTHILTYPNGKRTLITLFNGKWKA